MFSLYVTLYGLLFSISLSHLSLSLFAFTLYLCPFVCMSLQISIFLFVFLSSFFCLFLQLHFLLSLPLLPSFFPQSLPPSFCPFTIFPSFSPITVRTIYCLLSSKATCSESPWSSLLGLTQASVVRPRDHLSQWQLLQYFPSREPVAFLAETSGGLGLGCHCQSLPEFSLALPNFSFLHLLFFFLRVVFFLFF